MNNPHWYIAGKNNGNDVHVWRYVTRGEAFEFATTNPKQKRVTEYLPRVKAWLDSDRSEDFPEPNGFQLGLLPEDKVEKPPSSLEIAAIDFGSSQH